MGIRIRCRLGLHSWSGRVCCKCGAKKGEKRFSPKSASDLKPLHFPVDLYNHGVRFLNDGNAAEAMAVFLQVYNHPTLMPSFRWIAMGSYAIAARRIKCKCEHVLKRLTTDTPKEFSENQQMAIAVFTLVNLVRSIDPTIEAMTIRADHSKNQFETDFTQKGIKYLCTIMADTEKCHGALWRYTKDGLENLNDPASKLPLCKDDNSMKKTFMDWMALKPKLPFLPINFILSI